MRPHRVSAAGQKKGIFEHDRAKAGQKEGLHQTNVSRCTIRGGIFAHGGFRVRAGAIDGMSLPTREPAIPIP
jgi:hypothetical protein